MIIIIFILCHFIFNTINISNIGGLICGHFLLFFLCMCVVFSLYVLFFLCMCVVFSLYVCCFFFVCVLIHVVNVFISHFCKKKKVVSGGALKQIKIIINKLNQNGLDEKNHNHRKKSASKFRKLDFNF